jgi:hypothetical protein
MGSCTAGKLQRILASARISQHAKLNMAGFVLYLLGHFPVRCRMVELHPKARKIEFPAGNTEGRQRPWIAKTNANTKTKDPLPQRGRAATKKKHPPRRHGDTEKSKSKSQQSKSKPQHGGHGETSEDAESRRLPNKILRGMARI